MAKTNALKHNKIAARLIILVGTFSAGLGIWVAVNQVPASASGSSGAVQDISAANPNFNAGDTFLSQPQIQTPSFQSQPVGRTPRLRTRGS